MIELSIIIPHYNSIEYLKRLIKSIPNNNKIEIIVIDDNSNKDLEELNKIKKDEQYNNVKFMKNNTSIKGAGTCRNIGISQARGKWLLFADADDFFIEGFYEVVEKFFNTKNDIVYFCPTSIENETGEISDRHIRYENLIKDYIENPSEASEVRLKYRFVVPWSKLIRTSLVTDNKIRFDEVIASNDIMFSTKVGSHIDQFQVSSDTIYCVTKGKGSLTNKISEEVFDTRVDVLINYCNYLKNNLTKSQVKYINQTGMYYVVSTLRYKFGLKKTFEVIKKLRRNKVNLIRLSLLNPINLINDLFTTIKKHKTDKKYYVK